MANARNVSGDWQGHYEQDGGRHGIRMQVAQVGQSFVGEMRDEDTVLSGRSEIAVYDEAECAAEAVELETMGVLPERSIVEGTVEGDRVVFDKCYQGAHTQSAWIDGGDEMHLEVPAHTVRYEGELEPGGDVLRGRWSIPGEVGDDGEPVELASGTFELRREV